MREGADEAFEAQLEQLLAVSNARRRRTVEGLVKVLDDLRARGTKVFSVAIVGRECEARTLLTTQYIRNVNGAPLRRLIDAYREKHGLRADSDPVRRQTPLEEAINKIADLDVRTKLFAIIDDNKALVVQLQRMEEGFKHLVSPSTPALPPVASLDPAVEILPPATTFMPNLRPLDRFISRTWLDQNAWTVSEAGSIMDGQHAITPPGFVLSLASALRILRKDDGDGKIIEKGYDRCP